MSEYTVKTYDNRNLVIEADDYDSYDNQYRFFTGDGPDRKTVARVFQGPSIFAILKNEAEKSDHYYVYDWNKEDEKEETEADDVCNDCRTKELLDDDAFFNAVWAVVEGYHEPDFPEPLTLFQATKHGETYKSWVFWYKDDKDGDVFVPFGSARNVAQDGLNDQIEGKSRSWSTWPLSDVTPVPETIQ